jgi:hypothetical protein
MKQACARNLVLSGAVTVAVLVACGQQSARAQDDSGEPDSIWNLERRVWGGLMRGLGLRSADDPVIEYRERSPLVVPPNRDLPTPQSKSATNDPAWPADPDAARKRKRVEKRAHNDVTRERDRQGNPISPQELNPTGATRGADSGKSNAPQPGTTPDGQQITSTEPGVFSRLFSGSFGFGSQREEYGTFTSEPPRNTLTAPPQGYQTPSPAQPYGVSKRTERTAIEPANLPEGRR